MNSNEHKPAAGHLPQWQWNVGRLDAQPLERHHGVNDAFAAVLLDQHSQVRHEDVCTHKRGGGAAAAKHWLDCALQNPQHGVRLTQAGVNSTYFCAQRTSTADPPIRLAPQKYFNISSAGTFVGPKLGHRPLALLWDVCWSIILCRSCTLHAGTQCSAHRCAAFNGIWLQADQYAPP